MFESCGQLLNVTKRSQKLQSTGYSFLHRCELLFASPSCDTSLLRPVSGSDCQSGSHYGRSGRAMALCCYQTSNCHSPTRAAGAMANGPLQAQRRRTAQTHGSHWRRRTHYPWKNQKGGERSMYWISLASLAISVSGFIQKPIDAGSMLRKKTIEMRSLRWSFEEVPEIVTILILHGILPGMLQEPKMQLWKGV